MSDKPTIRAGETRCQFEEIERMTRGFPGETVAERVRKLVENRSAILYELDDINQITASFPPEEVVDRVDYMKTIINKLPKTADGVPVVPGMKCFDVDINEAGQGKSVYPAIVTSVLNESYVVCDIDGYRKLIGKRTKPNKRLYSTQAAARQAAGGGG